MTDCAQPLVVDLDGRRVAALAWGPENGRPVLALHGWLDNAASFAALAPRLVGIRLVALDFCGHGASDPLPPGLPYHFVDFVADVVGVADSLGWEQFAILGHSMGAGVAPLVAVAGPERVTGMALIEGLGPMSADAAETPDRLRRYLAVRRGAPSKPAIYADLEAAARRLIAAAPMEPASARILLERGTRAVPGGVTWRSDPRLRWPSAVRMTEGQVLAILSAVRAPTLLVRARQGYPLDPALMATRRAALPAARAIEVDGYHHVHLDRPELLEGPLQDFLAPGG